MNYKIIRNKHQKSTGSRRIIESTISDNIKESRIRHRENNLSEGGMRTTYNSRRGRDGSQQFSLVLINDHHDCTKNIQNFIVYTSNGTYSHFTDSF